MKHFILVVLLSFLNNFLMAQEWVIVQKKISDDQTIRIKKGDKVFISFKQLTSDHISRPNSIFLNSTDTSKTRVVLKARITEINENSIQFKDRTAGGNRTIQFDKIDGIRKLTKGKQILRTASMGIGALCYGFGIAAVNENIWNALLYWTGGSSYFALATDDFHSKYEKAREIKIVRE